MTISGGVALRCSSGPKSDDIVDSTDVSNWDEELAIGSVSGGEIDLQMRKFSLLIFLMVTKLS